MPVHFPVQDMSDDAQLALTELLGEPEANHVVFGKTGEVVYFGTIGNVVDDETKRLPSGILSAAAHSACGEIASEDRPA